MLWWASSSDIGKCFLCASGFEDIITRVGDLWTRRYFSSVMDSFAHPMICSHVVESSLSDGAHVVDGVIV